MRICKVNYIINAVRGQCLLQYDKWLKCGKIGLYISLYGGYIYLQIYIGSRERLAPIVGLPAVNSEKIRCRKLGKSEWLRAHLLTN